MNDDDVLCGGDDVDEQDGCDDDADLIPDVCGHDVLILLIVSFLWRLCPS